MAKPSKSKPRKNWLSMGQNGTSFSVFSAAIPATPILQPIMPVTTQPISETLSPHLRPVVSSDDEIIAPSNTNFELSTRDETLAQGAEQEPRSADIDMARLEPTLVSTTSVS